MKRRTFLTMAAVCGGVTAIPRSVVLAARLAPSEASTEGSPIVFNQLGYLPNARKFITLRASSAGFARASNTSMARPSRAQSAATVAPTGPAPTIATSSKLGSDPIS